MTETTDETVQGFMNRMFGDRAEDRPPKRHPMAIISELTWRWKAFDAPITKFKHGDLVRLRPGFGTMSGRYADVPLLFVRYLDHAKRYDWLLIEDAMKRTTLEQMDCLLWAYGSGAVVPWVQCSRRIEPWRDSHIADYEAAQADVAGGE